MVDKRLTVADFFCGAGGFSEGFRQKNFNVVFALDNWKPAIATHELNHPKCKAVLMDILELDTPQKIDEVVPDVDIIVGSPPCVAFSGSNKAGKADKSLGVKLIETYLRIIAWKKNKGTLKYWILENVPNSEKHIKDEYTWQELGLPGKGPSLKILRRNILNAAHYGAPQGRKRFVCGDYPEPEKTHENNPIKTKDVFKKMPNPNTNNILGKIVDPIYNFEIDASQLTDHFYDSRVAEFEWQRAKDLKENHGFMGKMSFPEDLDRPGRTVMATMSASTRESMLFDSTDNKGNHIGYRLPTIREIATFMSFPITYQFEAGGISSKYRLVGNAVCAKMSAALAEAIAKKEKIITPKTFLSLPDTLCSVNLNGLKKKIKEAKPMPITSKFEHHVPYIKIKGIRVQLSNIKSDFNKEKFQWTCQIRYGKPKEHKSVSIPLQKWIKLFEIYEKSQLIKENKFSKFNDDVKKTFNNLPDAKELQTIYCDRIHNKKSPSAILEKIKEIVDKHYPEKTFLAIEINNYNRLIDMDKDSIPLRIAATAYACSYVVENIKKN
jgi:DNA (cytosine-5)-methyltransferase 1